MTEIERIMNLSLNAAEKRLSPMYYRPAKQLDWKEAEILNAYHRYMEMSWFEKLKFKISQIWHPRNP